MKYNECACLTIRNLIRTIEKELPCIRLNRSIEPIHHLRVAARRLHNAFWVFKDVLPKKERKIWALEVKAIIRALSCARDLDVQIRFFRKFRSPTPGLNEAVSVYLRHLRQERTRIQPQLLKAIIKFERKNIVKEIKQVVGGGFERQRIDLRKKISQRLNTAMGYRGAVSCPQKFKELHQLRIALKHLRYTLEGLLPVCGRRLSGPIADVLKLHDLLGDLHDLHVWASHLRGFARTQNRAAEFLAIAVCLDKIYSETYTEFLAAWRHCGHKKLWTRLEGFGR